MATPTRKVRFGVQTPQVGVPWQELLRFWQHVDSLGFDTAWLYDHYIPIEPFLTDDDPCLEGYTALTALAASTKQVRLGLMVTGNTYRHPVILAKIATTLDIVSGGRLELGIGAAWYEKEHMAYGIPFRTNGWRIRRLAEAVQIIKAVWASPRVNFQGKYYQLTNAPFQPKPVQKPHPPILIGGGGEKLTLRIVAQYADIWNAFGPLENVRHKLAILEQHCRDVGRNPQEIEKSVLMRLLLSDNPQEVQCFAQETASRRNLSLEEAHKSFIGGNIQEVTQQIREFVDAGVTHIILSLYPPYPYQALTRFAQQVIPAFR